ncbi:MAG: tetratricopeptide repeat protein [Rhodobacteraceae bacterium]|nr:tetratricopeptide repeat protein [Paracoccaceae bacterium]
MIVVGVAATGPATADEAVTLTPDEMRAATDYALRIHDSKTALKLADALLTRDPADMFALIARARALRDLGRYQDSLASARDAWARAEGRDDRYAAALVTAQALSSMGRRTRAQIWLRRAAQNAPNDRAKAVVARDYAHVRERNPWSTRLTFGLTPSSNVNNGSSSDIVVIGGLPFVLAPSAKALSGQELRFGAETRYRMRPTDTLSLHLGAEIDTRTYRLSSAARASAPGVTGSDFAWAAAEISFGGSWAPKPDAGPLGFELTLGKSFYGGTALADYARLELTKSYAIAPRTLLRLTGSAEQQWRADTPQNDATVVLGNAALTRRLGNGDIVTLSMGLRDTESDGPSIANEARLASIAYRFAKPVLGARVGLNLAYEGREYDMSLFGGAPRSDTRLELGVSAFLPQHDIYGFAPEIGLKASRNRSNLSLYDSQEIGLTLGIRSAF